VKGINDVKQEHFIEFLKILCIVLVELILKIVHNSLYFRHVAIELDDGEVGFLAAGRPIGSEVRAEAQVSFMDVPQFFTFEVGFVMFFEFLQARYAVFVNPQYDLLVETAPTTDAQGNVHLELL
jgi:hypothetical protein